ncbi:unnamed protein product [Oikopleura dioica]|uniref:Uncharacterized protein n=1 Tax=Oikopleura dioica TaxID=34765 RepID=E4XKS2_OIKDI|nr:unnamed protein product [Oikopleura dioica]
MKVFAVIAGTFVVEGKPSKAEIFKMPDSYFEGMQQQRRYVDLLAITQHYNPGFDEREQWYYGCHCLMLGDRAMSTRGRGKPVDQLDNVCRQYKECIHCVKMEFGEMCIPEAIKYTWEVDEFGDTTPLNKPGTCKRAIYECDAKYARTLAETDALSVFNSDYHGFWSAIGWTADEECPGRGSPAQPECCGGHDKPYVLYNALNPNKQ